MYQKILAPLDGSEFSECILPHVKAVATGCGVPQVVLLEVIEPPTTYTDTTIEMSEDMLKELKKRNQTTVEDYLSKKASDLKKDGVATETVILTGNPAEKILDYATKNKVDLIIMSTHGRTGISRWVLGSVADRVMRHSTVPLLIVSPPGCRIS